MKRSAFTKARLVYRTNLNRRQCSCCYFCCKVLRIHLKTDDKEERFYPSTSIRITHPFEEPYRYILFCHFLSHGDHHNDDDEDEQHDDDYEGILAKYIERIKRISSTYTDEFILVKPNRTTTANAT